MTVKCPKCQTENPDSQKFCGECATPLQSSEDIPVTKTLETTVQELARGTLFAGRYEIIEELGAGGMGRVYRAEDKKIREEIALKLIKPEVASDRNTLERFSNELKLARKIRHKNVCAMFDLSEEKGTHYITMEYVRGQDLKSLIRQSGQLAVRTSINITRQLCEGLMQAHKLGVVHRDLKPSNIMIDKEGNVRIMDFGIARSLKAKGITGSGVMIGTPEYMSPEQAEAKEIDHRSDIYSLGVILYEMTTGNLPFQGDTPQDPSALNPQIQADLSLLTLKCMAKAKEDRYQTADQVLSALTDIEIRIPSIQKKITEKKPLTSKEITVTIGLKKFFIPALVMAAILICVFLTWQLLPKKKGTQATPKNPSIAVLPFDDLSPERDQEHFCDGFAESLINAMNQINDLRVPARTSSFSFKGKDTDKREIGERLRVENILEGSVQKADSRIRIIAQLISVKDESVLWSDQYDRELGDVFAIQDDIVRKIIEALEVRLLGEKGKPLVKRYTEDSEAYNLYLKGSFFANTMTEAGIEKAIDYFNRAIDRDPKFALAHVGLGNAYDYSASLGYLPSKEIWPKVKEEAHKALEIDNELVEAYALLADVSYFFEWDWPAAERAFQRVIELNPGHAVSYQWYSGFLVEMGRIEEGLEISQISLQLDPLSIWTNYYAGVCLYLARMYDSAIEQLNHTLKFDPNHWVTHRLLGLIYLEQGMNKKAITQVKKAFDLNDSPTNLAIVGYTHARTGNRIEAESILNELSKESESRYIRPGAFAFIHAGLRNYDRLFKAFDACYEERDSTMLFLKAPWFDGVRSDPRFAALLKKMNLD